MSNSTRTKLSTPSWMLEILPTLLCESHRAAKHHLRICSYFSRRLNVELSGESVHVHLANIGFNYRKRYGVNEEPYPEFRQYTDRCW